MDWSALELAALKTIVASVATKFAALDLAFPADFGDPLHPGGDTSYLENLFIHECFHIFSKNHPIQGGLRATG